MRISLLALATVALLTLRGEGAPPGEALAKSQLRLAPLGIANAEAENTLAGPFVGSGSCFYWLHTHAADGIIHIESPSQRAYTLGNLFDIWLGAAARSHRGPTGERAREGSVQRSALCRGPGDIPLTAHAQ